MSNKQHQKRDERRLSIRAERRNQPDVSKLSRALIQIALAQAKAEAEAQAEHESGKPSKEGKRAA